MTATAKPIETAAPQAGAADRLERIPLDQIHESKLNPRTRYDPETLAQLQESLLASGQLEPVLVRPRQASGYELAAGHRRYRAAKLACEQHPDGARYRGLHELRAIVRDLDDRTFVETLNIDNLQRDDLHPLEEAQGFRDLMAECGYDVKKIAARIGKSERYVYDSLTLLKLIPEAKKLFLAGRFERGHAIELARLSPEWQKEAIDPEDVNGYHEGGLWQAEHVGVDPNLPEQEALKLEDAVKPVSVRELKTWVNETVRFKPAETDPVLFPNTAALLTAATVEKEKVIEMTYEYQIPDEARDPKGPKIYGARAWRSATKGRVSPDVYSSSRAGEGKACEHSVVGVIVIGEGRGDAFRVCIAKEKCKAHWADWQKARAGASQSASKGGGSTKEPRQERQRREHERWEAQRKKDEAEQARWTKAAPALLKAAAEKIKNTSAAAGGTLADIILDVLNVRKVSNPAVPRGRTAEDFVRHAAFLSIAGQLQHTWRAATEWPKWLKPLGVDAIKIVAAVAPKPVPEKKPQTSAKPAKKARTKKGKKR